MCEVTSNPRTANMRVEHLRDGDRLAMSDLRVVGSPIRQGDRVLVAYSSGFTATYPIGHEQEIER